MHAFDSFLFTFFLFFVCANALDKQASKHVCMHLTHFCLHFSLFFLQMHCFVCGEPVVGVVVVCLFPAVVVVWMLISICRYKRYRYSRVYRRTFLHLDWNVCWLLSCSCSLWIRYWSPGWIAFGIVLGFAVRVQRCMNNEYECEE